MHSTYWAKFYGRSPICGSMPFWILLNNLIIKVQSYKTKLEEIKPLLPLHKVLQKEHNEELKEAYVQSEIDEYVNKQHLKDIKKDK